MAEGGAVKLRLPQHRAAFAAATGRAVRRAASAAGGALALESRGLAVEAQLSAQDERWMREALVLAGQAAAAGRGPGRGGDRDGRRRARRYPGRIAARPIAIRPRTLRWRRSARRRRNSPPGGWPAAPSTSPSSPAPCAPGRRCWRGSGGWSTARRIRKGGFCDREALGDLVRHPRLNHRLEVAAGVLAAESSAAAEGPSLPGCADRVRKLASASGSLRSRFRTERCPSGLRSTLGKRV
jgi:hypothetical protein